MALAIDGKYFPAVNLDFFKEIPFLWYYENCPVSLLYNGTVFWGGGVQMYLLYI
jgi:hypothetical protein